MRPASSSGTPASPPQLCAWAAAVGILESVAGRWFYSGCDPEQFINYYIDVSANDEYSSFSRKLAVFIEDKN